MITIRRNPNYPPLSIVSENAPKNKEGYILPVWTEFGKIINTQLGKFSDIHPAIKSIGEVIMPDHIHFLLYVTSDLEKTLPYYINKFKGRCSRRIWDSFPELNLSLEQLPLFEKGFNDKIIRKRGQLKAYRHYIKDNPRRLLITRAHPDFFYNTKNIKIGDKEYNMAGNFLLLEHPLKSCVIVSRKYSPETRAELFEEWRETIRECGVLVGAFIHPEEKAIKEEALINGARIIQIRAHGFSDKYKPSERDLPYCAKGQLLEIAIDPDSIKEIHDKRSLFLRMNEFAKFISGV